MSYSIMLVDDDESLTTLTAIMLKRAGYTTYNAHDGQAALDFLTDHVPDLFIIDVMMPGMSGFDLCRHLRARPDTANHPIILLSALSDQDNMFQGLESGANLYLAKPIQQKELIERIQEFLKPEFSEQE